MVDCWDKYLTYYEQLSHKLLVKSEQMFPQLICTQQFIYSWKLSFVLRLFYTNYLLPVVSVVTTWRSVPSFSTVSTWTYGIQSIVLNIFQSYNQYFIDRELNHLELKFMNLSCSPDPEVKALHKILHPLEWTQNPKIKMFRKQKSLFLSTICPDFVLFFIS